MIETVLNDAKLEEVEDGIFSCLTRESRRSDYDDKARAYDLVVGNAFYNRLVWGNWPANYAAFCRTALTRTAGAVYLDAGCGSLVFTAQAYAEADSKLIVLFDRSLGMLRRGRERIMKLRGGTPENIVFIQGDIFNLPFREAAFDTVGSFGVLHIFEEKLRVLGALERMKKPDGHLFFSSLVGNNAIGRKYLEMLKKAGEVATWNTTQSLGLLLSQSPCKYALTTTGNMAYVESRQR